MKKALTSLLALLLAVLFVLPVCSAAAASAPTETEVYNTLNGMKAQYPEGTPWGGDKFYAWKGDIYYAGYGCVAFAFILSDAAFGDLPARKIVDVKFSDVRAGDILRLNNDTHTVIVLRVYEDYVVLAEGSYNNSVHWGRVLTKADVEKADYMLTRYPDGSADEDPQNPQIPTENILAKGNCGENGLPNTKWVLSNTGDMFIYGTGKMDTYAHASKTPWNNYAKKISSLSFLGDLIYIAPYGFSDLSKLESVTINDTVEEIGVGAFANCTALNSVIMGSNVKKINSRAFIGCTALTSIALPSSLEVVNVSAFAQSGLKDVALPDGLTFLGNNAFEKCNSLEYAYIPGTVTNNFQYAFYACDKLSSVILGAGLKEIGRYSFAECPALKSVTFPKSMEEIGDNAFNASGLETVVLPEGLTTLCEYAFYSCENLKSVNIPSTVTTFESDVFAYCKALETVTMAEGLSTLGNSAFKYCQNLKSITIPSSIAEIKPYAFHNSGLTSVVLSEGVTTIGVDAFSYSDKLQSVSLPATLKTVKSGAFDRCDSLLYVYYYGSKAQWDAVDVKSNNYALDYAMFEYIDPNACRHTETVTIPAVAPQCDVPGWTAGKQCANKECKEVVEEPQYISPTGHSWKAATCTAPKTCRTCSQTQGSPNGHNWKSATCTTPKTCLTCMQTQGSSNGHNWKAATCTAPKTCLTCMQTQGGPNGQNWKEATCTEAKTCKTCNATEGKPNGHTSDGVTDCAKESKCTVCGVRIRAKGEHAWAVKETLSPADCTNPGEALYYCLGCLTTAKKELPATGHTWLEATCTAPKTCETCSVTEGEANGHIWREANCTEAKTCTTCSATEGDPVGHNWQEATLLDLSLDRRGNGCAHG